jgi:T5SS/PEP-CTERM-associated repeat protein
MYLRNFTPRVFVVSIAIYALVGLPAHTVASTIEWLGPDPAAEVYTGEFDQASNWDPSQVPGETDPAIFDRGASDFYTVTFASDQQSKHFIVRNDRLKLELGGKTYSQTHETQLGINAGDTGSVWIQNGTLSTGGAVRIGHNADTSGELTLLNAQVQSEYTQVGHRGDGLLSVLLGSKVTSSAITLGVSSTSTGTVQVNGPGSSLRSTSTRGVGLDLGVLGGEGQLNVTGGASIQVESETRIGNGVANVQGLDTQFTTESLYIGGGGGQGQLNVFNQAAFQSNTGIYIGSNAPTVDPSTLEGKLWITGPSAPGTPIVQTETLSVGFAADGELRINDGGWVRTAHATIAERRDSTGIAYIGGSGTSWEITEGLTVGASGSGARLVIFDTAQVSTTGANRVARSSSATAADIYVQDPGSQFLVTDGYLHVGNFGKGELVVRAGAEVVISGDGDPLPPLEPLFRNLTGTGNLFLASYRGSSGKLRVEGANSIVSVEQSLDVGGRTTGFEEDGEIFDTSGPGGSASVVVKDGAHLEVGDTLRLWRSDSVLDTKGTGSQYTGTINIGTPATAPIVPGTVRIGPDGTLAGHGTVIGNVVNEGGTTSPGLSIGSIDVVGDFIFSSGLLELEIGGTGSGLFDRLRVTGDVILDGQLLLLFVDGYLPSTNDLLEDLITGSSLTFGSNFNVAYRGAAPGWEYMIESTGSGSLSIRSLSNAQAAPAPSSIVLLLIAFVALVIVWARTMLSAARHRRAVVAGTMTEASCHPTHSVDL